MAANKFLDSSKTVVLTLVIFFFFLVIFLKTQSLRGGKNLVFITHGILKPMFLINWEVVPILFFQFSLKSNAL